MALYQLEGLLPYPVQQCVVSVRSLGSMGEATRVFVAVAHKPEIEQFIRVCQQAGLRLSGLMASSEAIGRWHQACWPQGLNLSAGWLVAEFTQEGIDLSILAGGNLVYMRHVPHLAVDPEDLIGRIEETLRAYRKEQIGPEIGQVTVSGWLEPLGPAFLERLEVTLALPVHRVDPLEASPFREALSVTAQELSPEVSFSELLGAVCAPRLLELDLLPLETKERQLRQAFFGQLRRGAVLVSVGVLLVLGWVGVRVGGTQWQLREIQSRIDSLNPPVARVKGMAATIQALQASHREYVHQMEWLDRSTQHLSPGMTLQFLGLEAAGPLTLRGTAPDLAAVTGYAIALREESLWKNVLLRSAKSQGTEESPSVEFEMVLQ